MMIKMTDIIVLIGKQNVLKIGPHVPNVPDMMIGFLNQLLKTGFIEKMITLNH